MIHIELIVDTVKIEGSFSLKCFYEEKNFQVLNSKYSVELWKCFANEVIILSSNLFNRT